MGNNDDDYIAADSHEQERIRAFLGVTQQWFRRRYIVAVDHGTQGIRIDNSGRCAFLDRANRCRIYAARPRHEIARSSELLQAQLLQPININPVQPRLAETDLNILTGAGPGEAAFNEFTPLLERDRLQLTVSCVAGNHET